MNDQRNIDNGRYESKGIENVMSWVKRCNPDMEYVDGFKDFDSMINIRCTKCGDVFARSMISIRHGSKTICNNCRRIAKEEKQRQIKENKRIRHEQAIINKQIALEKSKEATRQRQEERRHDCPVCGRSTTRPKYCSDKCSRIAYRKEHSHEINVTHEASRRIKIKQNLVDKDITLKKLYDRDKGRCWICGLQCDYNDKEYKGKTMIAGNMYPSIDHVVALSDGGQHSWDNVKLAHRICNTLRYFIPPCA